ncbi:hypothetical protein [Psychroflexus lacisalsi]|jgi:hypothetical protein|uniref:Uncharacterized protein n=1 Tax=Psychroflexus lacisalsi TaxID=503928 RepID=A0ABN1K0U3_9FLAO|nr:hypothetical protein [Psychroflexus lacisalsi]MBZ9620718.1 hypothetical protein [Psychroflexus lacisalsi]
MKKVIFTFSAVAIGFASLAFAPVEKSNDMNTNFVTNSSSSEGCDNFSRTYRDATECWTKSTSDPVELETAQLNVLNSY